MGEQKSGQVAALQAVRGVAAFIVLCAHCEMAMAQYYGPMPFSAVALAGTSGVDMFFVLSGFLMGRREQTTGAGAFLWARAKRIFPPYWAVLSALVVAYALTGQAKLGSLAEIAGSFLLLPHHYILAVSWTLTLELVFYGLFATRMVNRRIGDALLAIWALASLIGDGTESYSPLITPYAAHFAIGCLASRWHLPAKMVGVGCVAFAMIAVIGVQLPVQITRLPLAISAAVVISAAANSHMRRGILSYFGDRSYSLYLIHYPVVAMTVKAASSLGVPHMVAVPSAWAAALVAGVICYELVENKQGWLRRRIRASHSPAVTIH